MTYSEAVRAAANREGVCCKAYLAQQEALDIERVLIPEETQEEIQESLDALARIMDRYQ